MTTKEAILFCAFVICVERYPARTRTSFYLTSNQSTMNTTLIPGEPVICCIKHKGDKMGSHSTCKRINSIKCAKPRNMKSGL